METFFFTFGMGSAFRNKYVGVIAPNREEARHAIFECFDKKWAFQYDALCARDGLESQVLEFGIQPLLFIRAKRLENHFLEVTLTNQSDFTGALNTQRINAAA